MKVCTRCGSANHDRSKQCFYCKVELGPEGSFVSVPDRKRRKKLWSLLLLVPILAALVGAVYFFLTREAFEAVGLGSLYTGQNMELGVLLAIVTVALLIVMIYLLARDPYRHSRDEDDEEEEATYLMEKTPKEEPAVEETASAEAQTPVVAETDTVQDATPVPTSEETAEDSSVKICLEDYTYADLFANAAEATPRTDAACLRGMLAAMATARLLVIRRHNEDDDPNEVVRALCRALGTSAAVSMGDEEWTSSTDLYRYNALLTDTPVVDVIRGLYQSATQRKRAHLLTVMGLSAHQLEQVLADAVPFLYDPDTPCPFAGTTVSDPFYSAFGGANTLLLTENVWLVAIVDDAENAQLPDALNALYAELPLKQMPRLDDDDDDDELAPVSSVPAAKLLRRMADRAYDDYVLTEDTWKKLDLLEEYLGRATGFRFHNKLIRRVERYTSVYMAAGGTEAEAVDSVLSAGLLPMIANALRAHAITDEAEEESLRHFLDRVFGADNLPLTMDTVSVLKLS